MPAKIELIVTDFDGVITDNRVWTDETGKESVAASRSDSMHIRELRERGIEVVILSSEPNPVVRARAAKMGDVEAVHGIDIRGKGVAFKEILARKHVDAAHVIYIGNDLNDLPCFELAGWSVAVADAYPELLRNADHVLVQSRRLRRREGSLRNGIGEAPQRGRLGRGDLQHGTSSEHWATAASARVSRPTSSPRWASITTAILEIAKQIIDAAVHAGADAVKFQKRTPEVSTPPGQQSQMRETPWGYISYLDYRRKVEFGVEQYREIDHYCGQKGIRLDGLRLG